MRYMMLVKAPETVSPTPALISAVGQLSQEMAARGVLLDTGGLAPSASGARIRLSNARLTFIDGPFTESKELVGGFAVLEAGSKAEAVEFGRRFMQLHADHLGPEHVVELEIREMCSVPPVLQQ